MLLSSFKMLHVGIHVDRTDSECSSKKRRPTRLNATSVIWFRGQSEKTCRRPDELPPSNAFLVGWKAVTGSTVLRFSLSMKECWSWPVSWNTCSLRGFNMLPTAKHPSCLGSHTADILLSQRPVCMSCLRVRREMTGRESHQTQLIRFS